MKDSRGKIIYVGKAKSLRDRVASYFRTVQLLPKTARLVRDIAKIDHIVTEGEIDALLLEANLIRRFQPKYNVDRKDGKNYPLLEITVKDKIPLVRIARTERDPKALYFGPFPKVTDLTGLLRYLRRIFPFVSQNHRPNVPCLRSDLGLCPCPDVFLDAAARLRYLRNLRNLRDFLSGKRAIVQKRLMAQMLAASKTRHFEQAYDLKKKLEQIEFATAPKTLPWEYETNPNLTEDKRAEELESLAKILHIQKPTKIESYDISNTAGKLATGAQVTFVDGFPDKNLYRRYRIRFSKTPNDYEMLAEMLKRRLKSPLPLPELMVIDGGEGQLTTALSALSASSSKKPVTVIALAKRLETIYTPKGVINLPESSSALQLLQRLRDEAHRFSRRYHFLLRTKNMLT